MFYSIKEVGRAEADLDFKSVAELMIATEYQLTGQEQPEVLSHGTQSRSHESLCRAQPQ